MVTATTTHPTKNNITWARLVSNLFSPPVIWGTLAFPIAFREASTQEQGLIWALTYVILVCVMPAFYIGLMVWRGHITDLHMRVREQRIRPYIVSIICTVIAWVALNVMQAPPLLPTFAFITVIQIVAMLIVTLVWQISMHTMSVTSAIVTTGALFGFGLAMLASPLIPLVGAARYSLGRHTLSQLIAGSLLGGLMTLALILLTNAS